MRVGVSYYPEHWDPGLWELDAERMAGSGVSVVRMGEGAWGRFEPADGAFDFGWMAEALDVLHRHGLRVILGTPTYAPPTWLTEAHPEVLIRDAQGHPRYPGVRMHRCVNSPTMRHYAGRIVSKMADALGGHPAVFAWQIDNELEMSLCTCDACADEFPNWLKNCYETLDAVNEAWGTAFWSGQYRYWPAIRPPLGGSTQLNPSYQLDYYRFQNDSLGEFVRMQADILRKQCPTHLLTHNTWEDSKPLAYPSWFEGLDVAGVDYYPKMNPGQLPACSYHGDFFLDKTRGIKRKNFWVLEQQTGNPLGCWGPMDRTAPPGALRAFAWQSVSQGADLVSFFTWRSPLFGAEQLGGGLLGHDNVPRRRFHEFQMFCEEVGRLAPMIEGTEMRNEVAVLYLHDQARALQIQPHTPDGISYDEVLEFHHEMLNRLGIGTDVVQSLEGLSQYKLLIAPLLFLADEALAQTLTEYVEAGGSLFLTYRSGIKDLNNKCHAMPVPGPLAALAGVEVEEWDAIGNDHNRLETVDGGTHVVCQWADIVNPTTARPLAWYAEGWLANRVAVTINRLGKGRVYYLGAGLDEEGLRGLYFEVAEELGIASFPDLPEGMHTAVREKEGIACRFVLNLTNEPQEVRLHVPRESLLHGYTVEGTLALEPFGVEVLREATR